MRKESTLQSMESLALRLAPQWFSYKLIKVLKRELSAALEEDNLCFIFRHFPQAQIHPQAQRAAEAAASQGRFWSMHDTLFSHHKRLENGYLVEYANYLGLDIPQFLKDLPKQMHINRINEDIEGAINTGITTAPALFINENRYTGHWNMTELMAAMIAASH